MATFIMLPDGVTGTNEWVNDGGETATADHVDNDNGDTQYAKTTASGKEWSLTFADPSVDEALIDEITSVQIITSTKFTNTSGTGPNLKFSMGSTNAGINISNGTTTTNIPADNTYAERSSDVEQYMVGTTAWTYAALQVLKCKIESSLVGLWPRFRILNTSYIYANVTYVEVGYGNDVMGVDSGDISKINDVASANISKVIGV